MSNQENQGFSVPSKKAAPNNMDSHSLFDLLDLSADLIGQEYLLIIK